MAHFLLDWRNISHRFKNKHDQKKTKEKALLAHGNHFSGGAISVVSAFTSIKAMINMRKRTQKIWKIK